MVHPTKSLAGVGLAQARPNNTCKTDMTVLPDMYACTVLKADISGKVQLFALYNYTYNTTMPQAIDPYRAS